MLALRSKEGDWCPKIEDAVFLELSTGKCSKESERVCPYKNSVLCLLRILKEA